MDFALVVQTVALYAIPVLFAITLHEAAHGYAANHCGDPTARRLGRITLNPLRHIDPLGTIALPLLLFLVTQGVPGGPFVFGFAKPVPVNFDRLRRPRFDTVRVALAGPGANLAQAVGWLLLLYLLFAVGMNERFWLEMCRAGVTVNLVMFAFNLFPLPPLDGGRVLVGLLPARPARALARIEPLGIFIVLALVVTGLVGTWWLRPLMDHTLTLIEALLSPIRQLLL